jgi:CBS domain-containing protein
MLKVRDVMTREVLTVTPDTTLREAAELFVSRHVSGAPVVEGQKVVGVVSATDVLEFVATNPPVPRSKADRREIGEWAELPASEPDDAAPGSYFADLWDDAGAESTQRFADSEGPEWDVFAEHTVQDVMTQTVCSLPSTHPITAAAEYMKQASVHRLLVIDQGELVGIITSSDIARAVADHKLQERRFVFDRR